ncbi:hypothetical protein AB0D49_33325 [Streptomyces sp. NPDC048290]|uniref:hypothetical protein n=1 Tax=Streptomyces sp. NPDC048290 TaxID=3155811 RepID=UPI003449BB36
MAELVRQYRLKADVGFHAFGLQESDDADLPTPFPDDFEQGVFLNAFPGRLDFHSAGHTHTALVDVEVWDGPPPQRDPSGWDEQGEADFVSSSGEVAVWSMSLGRTEEVFALGGAGRWRVRAGCTGRARAAALSEDEGTGEGVERYLVEFWPAGRVEP